MARLPRMVIPGQPQHVIVRGNNRSEIFCCDADYRFYLEKLQAACKKHDCHVHAYVLMTNHVHLLMTPFSEVSLGKALQMQCRAGIMCNTLITVTGAPVRFGKAASRPR
jgi:putative transposase